MRLWSSSSGIVEVELTSAEPERALTAINNAGIDVFQMHKKGELISVFSIAYTNYSPLTALCKKRGEHLKLVRKKGLFWTSKIFIMRKILLGTILAFFMIALFLPTRVLFVRIEGNSAIPSERIRSAAEECGVYFGALRKNIRSEKVKNALLSTVPQLEWVGVNTYGCVALIQVRERVEKSHKSEITPVNNIVANTDGFILSGLIIKGTGLFAEGQSVKAGQVLISGYTDRGYCVQYSGAEGEIFAQTNRNLQVKMPSKMIKKGKVREVKHKYSIRLRKKRIILWKDSGISGTSCGRMYKEYCITLPGNFRLPVALCIETYTVCETEPFETDQLSAECILADFAESYLSEQMISGKVLSKRHKLFEENGYFCFKGNYICTEMIGRVQREQIGELNGKTS